MSGATGGTGAVGTTGEAVPKGFKSWKEYSEQVKSFKRKRNEEKIQKRLKRSKEEAEQALKASEEAARAEKALKFSTVSIAVPGSILENAQSAELRCYLGGQIARAACIFSVDEIVVFDDQGDRIDVKKSKIDDAEGAKVARRSCVRLAKILQYLECPQYLRKFFFPIHEDLKYAGILNPLDAPHHLRVKNDFHFREGVVTTKPVKVNGGSIVNVGLLQDVTVDKILTPGLRVTVRMLPPPVENCKKLKGKIESPAMPRAETGVYWGYAVRIANTLSEVFSKCPYKGGYDVTVGTSDKGADLHGIQDGEIKFRHALVLFGGLQGIEAALEADENLNVDDPSLLFDRYVNAVPTQGSRTIRTEEAILVTMSALRSKLRPKRKTKEFTLSDRIAQSCETPFAKRQSEKETNGSLEVSKSDNDMSRFD